MTGIVENGGQEDSNLLFIRGQAFISLPLVCQLRDTVHTILFLSEARFLSLYSFCAISGIQSTQSCFYQRPSFYLFTPFVPSQGYSPHNLLFIRGQAFISLLLVCQLRDTVQTCELYTSDIYKAQSFVFKRNVIRK